MHSVWWKQWKQYVGFNGIDPDCFANRSHFPGPIDNNGLFEKATTGSSKLRQDLVEGCDYELLSVAAWTRLKQLYQLAAAEHEIPRLVIAQGMYGTDVRVEIYPIELTLVTTHVTAADKTLQVPATFSRLSQLSALVEHARTSLGSIAKSTDECRCLFSSLGTEEELKDMKSTLQELGIQTGHVFCFSFSFSILSYSSI